jgi:iron complex transport system substrate-binding protein
LNSTSDAREDAAIVIARILLALIVLASPAAAAERIISLAPSITETLFALGLGDKVVGVSTYCDYPPAAAKIDRVGTFLQPNVERILTKKPDLVIAVPSPGNRGSVERLRDLGVAVLIVDPERIAQILDSIRRIADAAGVPDAGAALVARIEADLAAVEAKLRDASRPRALMLVGRTPFVAAGPPTYQGELLERAHATNLVTGDDAWPRLSLEFIVAQKPEVIIDASMGSEAAPDRSAALAFWQGFPTIPAVRDGRVGGQGASELLRPGPRVAETLATVARFIHPERFEPEQKNGTTDEHR